MSYSTKQAYPNTMFGYAMAARPDAGWLDIRSRNIGARRGVPRRLKMDALRKILTSEWLQGQAAWHWISLHIQACRSQKRLRCPCPPRAGGVTTAASLSCGSSAASYQVDDSCMMQSMAGKGWAIGKMSGQPGRKPSPTPPANHALHDRRHCQLTWTRHGPLGRGA